MTIIAAADGSALGNPGPAGWAWYVDDGCWDAGGWTHATNNQGELMAVLQLLRATAHIDGDLLILCDSQYVINSVTKWMPGWKRKEWRKADGAPVMNVDLLKELDDALRGRDYRFEWVRGHVGHPLNEAADVRARAAAEAFRRGSPVPRGPGFTHAAFGNEISNGIGAGIDDAINDGIGRAIGNAVGNAIGNAVADARTSAAVPRTAADELPASDDPMVNPDDDALFRLDEPEWHSFTVNLTTDEHERLLRRARERGIAPEELLRGLI